MATKNVQSGDRIQLNEAFPNTDLRGAFAVVDEVLEWGVLGSIYAIEGYPVTRTYTATQTGIIRVKAPWEMFDMVQEEAEDDNA